MTTTLEAALDAAGRGWPTFPLGYKQKIPLPGSKGFTDATTDESILTDWFERTDYNIGLATGKHPKGKSELLILDVDWISHGHESLQALQEKHGELPQGASVLTGRGRHYYFNMPDGIDIHNSAGKVGNGLDIRGTGGYVVYPPSRHPNGNVYEWEENGFDWFSPYSRMVEAPSWLVALATAETPSFQTLKTVKGNYIPQGQRNAAAISIAGFFRRYGFEYEQIAAQLRVLPFETPMTEAEIRTVSLSATRYEKEREFSATTYNYDITNLEKEL